MPSMGGAAAAAARPRMPAASLGARPGRRTHLLHRLPAHRLLVTGLADLHATVDVLRKAGSGPGGWTIEPDPDFPDVVLEEPAPTRMRRDPLCAPEGVLSVRRYRIGPPAEGAVVPDAWAVLEASRAAQHGQLPGVGLDHVLTLTGVDPGSVPRDQPLPRDQPVPRHEPVRRVRRVADRLLRLRRYRRAAAGRLDRRRWSLRAVSCSAASLDLLWKRRLSRSVA